MSPLTRVSFEKEFVDPVPRLQPPAHAFQNAQARRRRGCSEDIKHESIGVIKGPVSGTSALGTTRRSFPAPREPSRIFLLLHEESGHGY